MKTCKIDKYHYILSNKKPMKGDCYVSISTDSTGIKLYTGIRLESNENTESHKNYIKILATDNIGLNLNGCPKLEGFIL